MNVAAETALAIVREAGYRVSKPKARKEGATVNPFDHPFPHAKLINNSLTPISRLLRPYSDSFREHLTR